MDPAAVYEAEVLSRHRDQIEAMEQIIERGDSDIQRFYENSVVFITGGSGFLGKLLLEKLFRTCNIRKVFMLIRAKKGKAGRERIDNVFNDTLFDCLKKRKPRFVDSVVPVSGDIGDLKLGMSDLDWHQVASEVDVIFHLAATTRFDENLRTCILVNVRATREVVVLAKACKELRSFVHVSTAFSHATYSNLQILDQFYPAPMDPDLMIKICEAFDSDRLTDLSEGFIKGWVNNYTFSKALGEEVVRRAAGELPLCVVRPGAVVATHWDPTPGWMDISCAYSATGFIIGPGVGLTRVLYWNPEGTLGLIPGDIVNNTTIAAGWKAGTMAKDEGTKIYTVASSKNPITMGEIIERVHQVGHVYPTPKAIWYTYAVCMQTKFTYKLMTFFLHHFPAFFLDLGCLVMGKGRMFNKIYNKIDNLALVLGKFAHVQFTFDNSGVEELTREMSESDRLLFDMDIRKVKWADYIMTWCVGARRYIIKDELKDTEYARKKQFYLRIANFCVALLYLYAFYKILSFLYSFCLRKF